MKSKTDRTSTPVRGSGNARRHVYRIRFSDEELAELQALATERRVPASVVLRELVRNALSRHKVPELALRSSTTKEY